MSEDYLANLAGSAEQGVKMDKSKWPQGPCNPDQQRAVEAAVTYSIDFDATYGFMAIPSRDDGDIFLLPGNCVAEAEAFAQRIGLRVVT